MEFFDPRPDHLTVQDVASITQRSAKTVRRAVQAGRLPRRYVFGPHGPYLVFLRAEVEKWHAATLSGRARRDWHRPPRATPPPSFSVTKLLGILSDLQAALNKQLLSLREYHAILDQHESTLQHLVAALLTHAEQISGRLNTDEDASAHNDESEVRDPAIRPGTVD